MNTFKRTAAAIPGLWAVITLTGISIAQEPSQIWREFTAKLKGGTLTTADMRPEYTKPEQQLTWLTQIKEAVDGQKTWEDWAAEPEIFRVENHVQVLARFRIGAEFQTRCFTFLVEEGRWFYSHMEMIYLRLDQVGNPPVSQFPDAAEEMKAWIREETYWSTIILNIYAPLAKEKGAEYVFNLLKDGPGYFVSAKTWVPFLPPRRAFILWLCWEQSRLHGNQVILERLTDNEAAVKMQTHFFFLYKNAAHMKNDISFPDYRRLFETLWTDRAEAAGWTVAFEYADAACLDCVLRFKKK